MNGKKSIISVLTVDHEGVLMRVTSLFSRRGFNIESLIACHTQDPAFARWTVVVTGDEATFTQFTRQLLKLEDVIKVEQLEPEKCIQTELLLVKIATGGQPAQALKLVQAHGGRVLDIGKTTITVEFTGQSDMVDRVVEQMETLGIVEMARTGMTALERGDTTIHADMNL